MPLRSNFHAFLHRICEGTDQIRSFFTLFLFLFSISHFSVMAQSIESDEVDSEGIRTTLGSLEIVRDFKDKVVFNVGLGAITRYVDEFNFTKTFYYIRVKTVSLSPYEIKKGMILLLKTTNDEVIQLKAVEDFDAVIRDIHDGGGFVYSDYSTVAWYPITEDELYKVCQGIKKIRQEHSRATFDKEYKKDKIGNVIKLEYAQIKSALKTKKSITDGF